MVRYSWNSFEYKYMKGMWMKFWVVGNWASDFRIFKNYICSKISVILYFFTTFMYMFEINHLYPVFSSLAHLIHRWIHWFTFLHALLNPWTNSLEVNFLKHVIIEYKSWQNVLKSFSVKILLKTSQKYFWSSKLRKGFRYYFTHYQNSYVHFGYLFTYKF